MDSGDNGQSAANVSNPSAVVLVGFMGAGKTSVGQDLAQLLGWRFVDLDDRIVARAGKPVAQIFDDSGEGTFRNLEAEALVELLRESSTTPFVLAVGGGAFAQDRNRKALKSSSLPVIWLDAPVHELAARCAGNSDRPLARDMDQFRHLYEERRGRYMEADMRVDTFGVSVREVAQRIVSLLQLQAAGSR